MIPILTVTLNPALDLSTSVDAVLSGPKLRCAEPRVDPGGGGINVSRVISRLGGATRAFVALGGPTGARLAAALDAEGILTVPFTAPGETRESLAVTDRATGEQYRFVMPGPNWSPAQGEAALSGIVEATASNAIVVLSGSLPPGLPADLPARLAGLLRPKSARLLLDTSGAALFEAARATAPAYALRMDAAEADTLAGHPLGTREETANFAATLIASDAAEIVVIARGAEGSVLVTAQGRWFSKGAKVPVKSKIGAGDSFVAAFALALARKADLPDALQYGMAAASAAVMTDATELCRAEDVNRLIPACPLTRL